MHKNTVWIGAAVGVGFSVLVGFSNLSLAKRLIASFSVGTLAAVAVNVPALLNPEWKTEARERGRSLASKLAELENELNAIQQTRVADQVESLRLEVDKIISRTLALGGDTWQFNRVWVKEVEEALPLLTKYKTVQSLPDPPDEPSSEEVCDYLKVLISNASSVKKEQTENLQFEMQAKIDMYTNSDSWELPGEEV